MQNTFKQVNKTTIKLNNTTYKGYNVGDLPPSFGFKQQGDKQGKYQWFNYNGLTYIEKTLLPW
tara:strand:+ start:3535 stop:3723 length:189 start_codon:yes stop_codon:yes gene_type:complete